MRMKLLPLAAAIALMASAGAATAGTVNDDFLVTLEVGASCQVIQEAWDINMVHDSASGDPSKGGSGNSMMSISCNKDLPFTVSVDAAAGGAIVLTDATTLKTVDAYLTFTNSEVYSMQIWGSVANGEAYADVGQGRDTSYDIGVTYGNNVDPAVGTYTRLNAVAIDF